MFIERAKQKSQKMSAEQMLKQHTVKFPNDIAFPSVAERKTYISQLLQEQRKELLLLETGLIVPGYQTFEETAAGDLPEISAELND